MDEDKIMTRKQKAEQQQQQQKASQQQSPKKPRHENDNGRPNRKSSDDGQSSDEDYEKLRKATEEHLSVDMMREILEANDQDVSGSNGLVITKWYSRCLLSFI